MRLRTVRQRPVAIEIRLRDKLADFGWFFLAGIPVESIRGRDIAVFGASMTNDYSRILSTDADTIPRQGFVGTANAALPNRVSWYFDLCGPSVHIDTACSSSMVALDMACQAMCCGDATAVGLPFLLVPLSTPSLSRRLFHARSLDLLVALALTQHRRNS
jgi:hypothetical protein